MDHEGALLPKNLNQPGLIGFIPLPIASHPAAPAPNVSRVSRWHRYMRPPNETTAGRMC